MSTTQPNGRRTYGSGSLIETHDSWFGKWRVGSRQVKRKLGPKRTSQCPTGLTGKEAEKQLRVEMERTTAPLMEGRITITQAGENLIEHLVVKGRKHTTIRVYEGNLRLQIGPRLGARLLVEISRRDVEQFVARCLTDGLAPKTTGHCLGLLHQIFEHSIRNEWAMVNPCKGVDKPKSDGDRDIHYLESAEYEALLRAVPDDEFGSVQRVIYLAAVMTGMRQGELLALRWTDIDWKAQRIRIRRNYVRGEFGTPKTRRGSRSVPLHDRLGGELDLLYQRTEFKADDDLVFANPHTGQPMNAHSLLKAFQRALKRAGVRKVRFHDLRHTFGTTMAGAGVPMRTLQEWMGHRDFATTLIYADYAPGAHEVELVNAAFGSRVPIRYQSAEPDSNSDQLNPERMAVTT